MDFEDGLLKTASVAGVASSKGAAFGIADPSKWGLLVCHNHRITLWNLIHNGLSNLLRRVDPRRQRPRSFQSSKERHGLFTLIISILQHFGFFNHWS
jgi:hypothetical protein